LRMKVERYNYPGQFGSDLETLLSDIRRMLLQGHYVLSGQVSQFEGEFAEYLGVSHVRGVNSGTDALIIALRALGVGPGDEVITQANTFYATVAAIHQVGATPVLVDADENSFLMDVSQLPSVISSKTQAVLPVHLYGKPAPMGAVMSMAKAHALAVVEDAAQAHGARLCGKMAGTFGDIGCFSFHPSKNLAAAGDGGAIATNSAFLDERVRCLRELGQTGQNNHVSLGFNSKLDAIQARILSWKLPHLDLWNEQRRKVAAMYTDRLSGLPIRFQSADDDEEHAFHLFQIRTPERDALLRHLQKAGVDAVVRYPSPIHLQTAFAEFGWQQGQFPVAERLAKELLCLPIRPDLSVDELDYVCDQVRGFFAAATVRPPAVHVPE
jgi:dTDP-4-amino-4,6-dideoxygalactose transaminase